MSSTYNKIGISDLLNPKPVELDEPAVLLDAISGAASPAPEALDHTAHTDSNPAEWPPTPKWTAINIPSRSKSEVTDDSNITTSTDSKPAEEIPTNEASFLEGENLLQLAATHTRRRLWQR